MDKQLSAAELQAMLDPSRFHQLFSPEVLNVDYDSLQLTVKMTMREEFERQPGTEQWHGGTVSAIIDTVGCYTLALLAQEPLPTINFRTDYLRPAIQTDLTAVGWIRQAGRRVGVVDVDVFDDANRLIALGRASYAVHASSPPAS
jgi:uncharacterized protein (TIGR00369 family)